MEGVVDLQLLQGMQGNAVEAEDRRSPGCAKPYRHRVRATALRLGLLLGLTALLACMAAALAAAEALGASSTRAIVPPRLDAPADVTGAAAPAAPVPPAFRRWLALRALFSPALATLGESAGLVPSPVDMSFLAGARLRVAASTYPARYDLRDTDLLSPVRDQGAWGTCWAFAAMASLESCLLPNEPRDLSEDNLIVNAGYDADVRTGGGNQLKATAYVVRWAGPVDEHEDVYGDFTSPAGIEPLKHLQEVIWVPSGTGPTDNGAIKWAVQTYGAVMTSVAWKNACYNAAQAAYYNPVDTWSDHSVCIVGWDDAFPRDRFVPAAPTDGAYIVRNSWGADWGEGGYFYVSYHDRRCGLISEDNNPNTVFNGAEPVAGFGQVYQYDPLGKTSHCGYAKPTWFANVFTARDSETVTAVGFYSLAPDTTYHVWCGPSLKSSDLHEAASGTLAVPGFHTVRLSTPLPLTANEPFAVAVRIVSPGIQYPVAAEWAIDGYSSRATSAPGQSFLSDGSVWKDITIWWRTGNVCLKAYTAPPTTQDARPPRTSLAGALPAWRNIATSLTLSASDSPGGSGVAWSECRLDGGPWRRTTRVDLAAPADHSNDGSHTVLYRSLDLAGNVETAGSAVVGIDTCAPTSAASRDVGGVRGKRVTLPFIITDPLPSCGKAAVTIAIRSGSRIVKMIKLSNVGTNAPRSCSFTVKLAKGRYAWSVVATDIAGNRGPECPARTLTVG